MSLDANLHNNNHIKAETTLEYYNHVDKDHEEKTARVVQELLERVDEPKENDAELTPEHISHQNGSQE